jgi:conserved oligomeric golgi complex component 5 (13S golgi transport complex 90 kDa subunit) (GTC-90) (golgi transport complex 1).
MNSVSVLDNSNNEASVNHLFEEVSVSYQLLKSSNGIEKLNQEISSIIRNHLEDLILQVNNTEILEKYLSTIQFKISTLLADLEKLRSRFNDLYNKISYRIVLLNRLHSTCDLLRRIIRFMNISKRLQQTDYSCADVQVARREIKKASQYVWELNSLIAQDDNLLKIEIIRNDLLQLGEKQNDILEIAISNFANGFQKQDANQVSVGLQVFFCFSLLQEKIKNFLTEKEDTLFQSTKEVFSIQSYTQSKLSGPGGAIVSIATAHSAVFRSKFWSNLEALIEEMYTSLIQIDLLFRILKKKRDPMNQVFLIDFISESNSLSLFISKINANFYDQMIKASNTSNLIKECLEADYPKLVKLMIGLWTRLREEKEIDIEKNLRNTLLPFESAYLSRSVSFMFDCVNAVFSDPKESVVNHNGSLVPTKEAIDSIVKTISNQLVISSVDANLNQAVGKNVAKVVQLFLVKCEQLVLVDGDATQVIGPSTKSQAINSTIVHRLESFRESMIQLLTSCDVDIEANSLIDSSLSDVDGFIYSVIDPLMNSVQDSIEAIILTIHSEDFSK